MCQPAYILILFKAITIAHPLQKPKTHLPACTLAPYSPFCTQQPELSFKNKSVFNPRDYLSAAKEEMTKTCIDTIQNIMGSGVKI